MSSKDQPLPKFGEWDVNNPASAEGFTVIFNKARDEKKTGSKSGAPATSTRQEVGGSLTDDTRQKARKSVGTCLNFLDYAKTERHILELDYAVRIALHFAVRNTTQFKDSVSQQKGILTLPFIDPIQRKWLCCCSMPDGGTDA